MNELIIEGWSEVKVKCPLCAKMLLHYTQTDCGCIMHSIGACDHFITRTFRHVIPPFNNIIAKYKRYVIECDKIYVILEKQYIDELNEILRSENL